jgi:WD40 repeat protein
MLDDEEALAHQQRLLETMRRNLRHLLSQAAAFGGESAVPLLVANQIYSVREQIRQLKRTLRANGIVVTDLPGEEVPFVRQSNPSQAMPGQEQAEATPVSQPKRLTMQWVLRIFKFPILSFVITKTIEIVFYGIVIGTIAVLLGVVVITGSRRLIYKIPTSTPQVATSRCIDPAPVSTTSPYTDELKAITFSPDSSLLASVSKDTVKLWKIESGILSHTPVLTLTHAGQLTSVAFSPNSQILASASAESKVGVKLWDTASGRLLNTFEQPDSVNSVAFAPDGKTLALGLSTSGSNDVPVRVVLVSDGSLVHSLREHTGPVYSVAFSPDGKRLVTASKDTTVKLWDMTNSSLVSASMHTFEHTSEVHSVAFSPDGQIIASALWERPWTIQLWKLDGTLLHTLTGHEGPVTSVSFAPNNSSLLASGATDHAVRLWDVNTGMPLARVCNSGSAIASVAFAPKSNLFAAGTGLADPSTPFDRKVLLWHLSDLLK